MYRSLDDHHSDVRFVFCFSLGASARLPLPLNCNSLVAGCLLAHQYLSPIVNPRVFKVLIPTSFWITILQVPSNPSNLLETMLTINFLNSVAAFT